MSIERNKVHCETAFSLVEVVLAVAVFATSIVAILGMMAPMNRTTAHVLDAETGSRLIESIEGELDRLGYQTIIDELIPTAPIFLYATPRGDRVFRGPLPATEQTGSVTTFTVDNLSTDSPSGIAQRDRYFLVTINLASPLFDAEESGSVPLMARVEWPYRLPTGPSSDATGPHNDPSTLVEEPLRHSFIVYFALTR